MGDWGNARNRKRERGREEMGKVLKNLPSDSTICTASSVGDVVPSESEAKNKF